MPPSKKIQHNKIQHKKYSTNCKKLTQTPSTKNTSCDKNKIHMKDTGKSSSRKLRRVICYTLYRMDPQKTHYKIVFSATFLKIKQTSHNLIKNTLVFQQFKCNCAILLFSILKYSTNKLHGLASMWEHPTNAKLQQKQLHMKDMGKSSSRKLRYVIYYTLYRMDPQ